jgi:hypothetical protein
MKDRATRSGLFANAAALVVLASESDPDTARELWRTARALIAEALDDKSADNKSADNKSPDNKSPDDKSPGNDAAPIAPGFGFSRQ